jgi:hypothetical protein
MDLTPGDKLWNGAIVSRDLARAYNSLNATIAAFERQGRPAPAHLLNGRHNLIASATKRKG